MAPFDRVLSVFLAIAICAFGLFTATPARAEYCTEIEWPNARNPDGDCRSLFRTTMNWGRGTTQVSLLIEEETVSAVPSARQAELQRMVQEVVNGVGPALSRLHGARMPQTVHLVIVNDHEAGGSRAETVTMRSQPEDCPIVLFDNAGFGIGELARSIAHEMFHCVQYRTWPGKMAVDGSRWWSEGSAEWFEDFALPARAGDSDIQANLRLFRTRSGAFPLTDSTYSNVVLFTWLGPERVMPYLNAMADAGMAQLDGASRALSENEYQRFAQAYVDETITTPSGIRLAGNDLGPSVPPIHSFTGVPGRDPAYQATTMARPLTLMRGTFTFPPAEYAPTGSFGTRTAVFSERRANWGDLPNPLRADCGARKEIRFAAMSLQQASLKVDPRTRAAGQSGNCQCPVGRWTISDEDRMQFAPTRNDRMVDRGEISFVFSPDHTARFTVRNIRFEQEITTNNGAYSLARMARDFDVTYRWETQGNQIRLWETVPLVVTERASHVTRLPHGISSSGSSPPKIRRGEAYNYDGVPKWFKCADGTLTISKPIRELVPGRPWDQSKRDLRYPRWGVYVKE